MLCSKHNHSTKISISNSAKLDQTVWMYRAILSAVIYYTLVCKVNYEGGGYSDLDWSGMCRQQLKTHTHVQGYFFFQKQVPIFRDFGEKRYPFLVCHKNTPGFSKFSLSNPENFENQTRPIVRDFFHEKWDPCLGISCKKTDLFLLHIPVRLNMRVPPPLPG